MQNILVSHTVLVGFKSYARAKRYPTFKPLCISFNFLTTCTLPSLELNLGHFVLILTLYLTLFLKTSPLFIHTICCWLLESLNNISLLSEDSFEGNIFLFAIRITNKTCLICKVFFSISNLFSARKPPVVFHSRVFDENQK